MQNILLIDDIDNQLKVLEKALRLVLSEKEAEIRTWVPSSDEKTPPQDRFEQLVDDDTVLVVTDYDLTGKGQTGLFGSTIVSWCQGRVIPVGDYSRANRPSLPKEPNQYEIRIPTEPDDAARYVAAIFKGFSQIRKSLNSNADLLTKKRSPIGVLSEILGRPQEESRFSRYGAGLGTVSAALVDQIAKTAPDNIEPTDTDKRKLLSYVAGHLLLNVVLRFPGPILSSRALAAYSGISEEEVGKIEPLFAAARYDGPFAEIDSYYWLSTVDDLFDELNRADPADAKARTIGQLNREAVEAKLGHKLGRHGCKRCQGENGGFLCPFTQRTVCQLSDCSVGSSGWIPAGARLCRVEKDFYDEWAPVLGF